MRKHNGMSLMALTLAFAACLGLVGKVRAQAQRDPANAALAFEKIKTLVGRWEATTDKGKASATYELVSGGESCWSARTSPERRK